MQYMCIVKATPQSEAGEMPSLELIEAMGQWIGGLKPGVFVSGGGLQPSAEGFRVNLSGGKVTVTDGPFTETHELVGGWAIVDLDTREEVVQLAKDFVELHRKHLGDDYEMQSEVRPIQPD